MEAVYKLRTGTTYPLLLEGSAVGGEYGYAQDNYAIVDHQGVLRYRSSGSLGNRFDAPAIRAAIGTSLTELAAAREEAAEQEEAEQEEEAEEAGQEEEAEEAEEAEQEEAPADSTSVRREEALPARFFLEANFPNPFNAGTTVRFGLMEEGVVSLKVYDSGGREVRELLGRPIPAGEHSIRWDSRDASGRSVASGVYLLRLRSSEGALGRKLLLLR